jgi:flagellar basal-body rod protein FlgB
MSYSLYPKSAMFLEKALDLRTLRHELLASNIANATTPGYRSKDISFEKELASALQPFGVHLAQTNPGHMSGSGAFSTVNYEVISPAQDSINNDLNSVDLDKELVKLSENDVLYNTLVTVLKKNLDGIQYAITEGGR